VVSGFALDVGKRMVDAVLVEAGEAPMAFETEVRKGIDPGLVEWVRGDTFRTRVWPVPARGRPRIGVEYVSDLPVPHGAGGHLHAVQEVRRALERGALLAASGAYWATVGRLALTGLVESGRHVGPSRRASWPR
jgi:hypothetical protein